MSVQHFRQLEIWQVAMELAEACYRGTLRFPASEQFGLTSQIRRSATSIAANIAEGHGRAHTREYLRHLSIARGSLMELQSHLLLSVRVGYLESETAAPLLAISDRVSCMLSRLQQALKGRLRKG